jgi:hypothetical protein
VVATKDLIKAGLINAGDMLVWKRRTYSESHIATVKSDGTIETADGKIHRTPSGAAKHLNGNKPVDGWLAWKLKSTGESLSAVREKIIN